MYLVSLRLGNLIRTTGPSQIHTKVFSKSVELLSRMRLAEHLVILIALLTYNNKYKN